jgi:competence protein ComFB
MTFIDRYDLENLKNEAEKLVFEELGKQLESYQGDDLCLCNDCVADMAAISLNAVKPYYHHSLIGGLYAAEAVNNEEYAESIRIAVMQAIKKVRKNPSHN